MLPSCTLRVSHSGGALFDKRMKYRYLLWRDLNCPEGKGTVVFVMLNPNRADETWNDPTIKRCIKFASDWGFNRLEVVNLFAVRALKPSMLRVLKRPIGPFNDSIIMEKTRDADLVIAAWGNHGALHNRDREVMAQIQSRKEVFCLGITNRGKPRHPLYVPAAIEIIRFDLDDPS